MRVLSSINKQSFASNNVVIAKSLRAASPENAAMLTKLSEPIQDIADSLHTKLIFSRGKGVFANLTTKLNFSSSEDSMWTKLKNWFKSNSSTKKFKLALHPKLSSEENSEWLLFEIKHKAILTNIR